MVQCREAQPGLRRRSALQDTDAKYDALSCDGQEPQPLKEAGRRKGVKVKAGDEGRELVNEEG